MQDSNIKISIIVPVYNVKDYIRKSIDSYLVQDFKDFEIILVDDGSTDGSNVICDEYNNKYNNIKVIHQKNSGAHTARNNALKIAVGKYICFFDADDYVEKNMLLEMYSLAEKNNLDLVISGFYIDTYYDDNNFIKLKYIPEIDTNIKIIHTKEDFIKSAILNFDHNMFYSPWNKLYKKEYLDINNITFPNTYRDDFPFVLSVIENIKNVGFTKDCYYHFVRKRSDSETQKFVKNLYDKREEEHEYMKKLFSHWGVIDDSIAKDVISRRYIDRIIECMVNLFSKNANYSKQYIKNEIHKMINNNNIDFALKFAKPRKSYLKIMYVPIKLKSDYLCYKMAKFINYIKNNNIKLFSKLKKNR